MAILERQVDYVAGVTPHFRQDLSSALRRTPAAALTLTIRAPYKGLKSGESIAVNGACLTVERVVKGGFQAHVVEKLQGGLDYRSPGQARPQRFAHALTTLASLRQT